MEPLQMLYISLSGIGGLFLLLSIFGGEVEGVDLDVGDADFDITDADVDVDSPSIISIRTLATFFLAFGIAGIICINQGVGVWGQIAWGMGAGVVVTLLYFLVMKGMYAMQGSSISGAEDLIGKEGVVTIPTTESGIGQVRVLAKVGSTEYTCAEKDGKKLKKNDKVTIVSSAGAGTLVVEKSK